MISSFYQSINIALLIIFILKLLKGEFFHVYLWQLKEYRLDRFLDYLKTTEAKRLYLSKKIYYKIFLILSSFLILFFLFYSKIYPLLVLGLFVWEVYYLYNEVKSRGFLRPSFTQKSFLILLTSTILLSIILYVLSVLTFSKTIVSFALLLLLFDLFIPFGIAIIVNLINPIAQIRKKQIIQQAQQLIKSHKQLLVIGITGSYGKSSTKEFLYAILSKKLKVLKTSGNVNTEMGVAKTIIKNLTSVYEVFIVEMGAYEIGEIKAICDLVKPQIGVLTAINEQHLALFGNIQNIISAKFELIDGLPEKGAAILNIDNEHIKNNSKKYKVNQIFYSQKEKADIFADNIIIFPESLNFNLICEEEQIQVKSKLLGKHNISNLLAASAVAKFLGMKLEEIGKAIESIEPLQKTLNRIPGINESVLIDDTYNANPEGVLSALEYLRCYPHKNKIFIISAMFELGADAEKEHKIIGKKIAEICSQLVIVNPNFAEVIKNSAIDNGLSAKQIIIEENITKAVNYTKKLLNKDTVVLFEGRGPEKILNHLKVK